MILQRGTFSVPMDVSQDIINKAVPLYLEKWVRVWNGRGLSLDSTIKVVDFPHSDPMYPNRRIIEMMGYFKPTKEPKERIFEVSSDVAKRMFAHNPSEVRIIRKGD